MKACPQAFTVATQQKQGLVAQAAEGCPQRACQANAVLRIFQGAEQVEEVVNLLLGEKGPAADEVVIQSVLPEGGFVELNVSHRPEKKHHVTGTDCAQPLPRGCALNQESFPTGDQGGDPAGNPVGF